MVADYFQALFQEDGSCDVSLALRGSFPVLNATQNLFINGEFSCDEIKQALFDMAPFKAPGPDGFHAKLYQRMWLVVGDSLCKFVMHFFETGCLPPDIKDTLLVLIPKEVLHSMGKKSTSKGFMAVKIDLEKAYDRLSWDFIQDTLMEVGLSEAWVRNIMSRVTSSWVSIAWHGQLMDWFHQSQGVRQGDAISPYLFVLCVERLGHLINKAVSVGDWKAIKLATYGPALSLLFFADDMVLFAKAIVDQMKIILNCLECICASSGQRVSFQKSTMFVSKNVDRGLALELSRMFGIPLTDNLGQGTPSIHGHQTVWIYKSHCGCSKYLSLAGRITLAKTVLMAIPMYVMQTALLPKELCLHIEKENATNESSFFGKGRVGLIHEKKSLWAQVVSSKYMKRGVCVSKFEVKQRSSNLWRGLVSANPILNQGMKKLVRNGKQTLFWLDIWLGESPLIDLCVQEIGLVDMYRTVESYWPGSDG
ncbi:uncharacterized protein LOC120014187 [Tripterygium wilfordii]|uniref:uncharacterized protein LOC120014187 n=1 Tax=Tripterygium wilfordii TaxID=458696 RepID=UPI0018F7EFC1|nr:uncharacterized protein LOC120014187 [Tripterygium wilfordii]